MIETVCAFTGHRPKSFPWGYNETARDCVLLKNILAEQIRAMADRGVTDFLSGMALGTDLWCAEIVLDLRRDNPALQLHCILPCEKQEANWLASEQERYHSILKQANNVVYVNREYSAGCMLERNHYLVDHAAILLAVFNGTQRSDTGATVRYARKLGRNIYTLNPISRTIIKETVEKRDYL